MINYKIHQRVNPRDLTAPRKYYAFIDHSGEKDLREVAKRIAKESTVSLADTMAVLEGLISVVPDFLLDGNIVRLGAFGTFRGTIASDGAVDEEEWNSTFIKKLKISFKLGDAFKNEVSTAEFQKTD